ncbi:mechanosensitive ion channel family protein [Psychrobacter sp. I-STPA6b]|uniref:mechanosensitive ion channel family protein n=1 Tax=Psychrobacter sp. I-STPA6b TaxID=2585718 RepID=UPI001D0CA532|nr:mechanosensitive ion channel family protein [Psychrobacter sp. I-STPA6b]
MSINSIRNFFCGVLLILSVTLPAHAVIDEIVAADSALAAASGQAEPTTAPEVDTPIEPVSAPPKDNEIRQRIKGIFSEIEGLHNVTVTVNQGVVLLGGETPNEKKAQQALKLAGRVGNVVTVEDNISRTLDVQDNVTPVVNDLKARAQGLVKALPLLLVALLVFAVVAWFGAWLSGRDSIWQRLTPNPFVAELLSQTIKVIFIIIGLILGLSLMGAEAIIGTLLGGAGVIGIAVGFAVKDTIENYISSLMLSVRQPFRARDQVVINGQEGIVVRLTSRATILMTLDGNQLRIPNSEVFKGTILNYTKNPERRFTFQLGVDANDDPIAAIKVGLDAINSLDFVLTQPKASANIDQVGDSNIVLSFQVWVDQSKTDFSKARSIAIREAKHALEDQGFSLPEPIYRLRFNGDIESALKQAILTNVSTDEIVSSPDTPISSDGVAPHTVTIEPAEAQKKIEAKQRAKKVLSEGSVDDILDARPDTKLMEKVEEEIAEAGASDLLDNHSPQE